MLKYIAKKIFGSRSDKILRSLMPIVRKINNLEKNIQTLSDAELKAKTQEFKERLKGGETFDQILTEAFAVVRETAKRVLNERHYDVQILGGLVLHYGMIAEMKTGEGKTLVSSLPAYLNSLSGNGVHVVTVNDYLAKRDSEWMGKIFKFHGLSVGCLTNSTPEQERKQVYACDIIYGTNNEFGFDYLRDNLKHNLDALVQRDFHFAIIDEVDSILIDEARTPLIISGSSTDSSEVYIKINDIMPLLREEDYELDEKSKTVVLTDQGSEHMESLIKQRQLIKSDSSLYDIENMSIVHHLNQAIKAHKIFKLDTDYIVKGGKVLIIDEFTGRIMDGRRYSEGLHQAIEAKEKVKIQEETQTLASITFQNYFRMYPKLAGMTGTAITEAGEFLSIYKLEVIPIPTNIPVKRIDEHDVIYKTEAAKYNAIIQEIKTAHANKQPILIGTISIEKSELISKLLKKEGIKHNVLNAKYHQAEAEIIAQAGQVGAVTIATNMAGRGTDIKLGGNEEVLIKKMGEGITQKEIEKIKEQVSNDKESVLRAGGLFVIGTERHESRRIDNQLRGRSGRQGDNGRTKFFLSLEDDLMRIFGSIKIGNFLGKLGLKDDEAIEHPWINKSLEKAQHKVEARNYEIRKNLLKFDDVMNEQRKVVYKQRLSIMKETRFDDILKEKVLTLNQSLVDQFIQDKSYQEEWQKKEMLHEIHRIYNIPFSFENKTTKEEVASELDLLTTKTLEVKKNECGDELFNEALKRVFLMTLDQFWKEHLHELDRLKTGISLRAYGQKDPLNEYKFEAFKLFENMFFELDESIISTAVKMQISHALPPLDDSEVMQNTIENKNEIESMLSSNLSDASGKTQSNQEFFGKISRNEPCPCGSKKKYKHCHGSIV
ncbi:preprotein translocase subunit SecA [Candidatus Bandiella euplotis]|uniref:Protein translocase subunit SecA n=1 Tax=Candidatus Bandiella euplotis TaxID=1664265 RepID=A0ABZ0UMK9_9RICK|nr:preprotein translocase subunit SecA [Candidatus Bandiella woodruffii]WPX96952.1 Protein translocase subunit SecA [Candidatus Bandiella woodruffii]